LRRGAAELQLAVWSDGGGLPEALLAKGATVTLAAGAPGSHRGMLQPAVTLPAGTAWVGLQVQRGRVVVALEPGEALAVATGGDVWAAPKAAEGLTAAIGLLAPAGTGAADGAGHLLRLRLDDRPVPLVPSGRDWIADLAGLVPTEAAGGSLVPMTLTVASAVPGVVTLRAPEISYRLGAPGSAG
jgi:hypothetical protein